MYVTQFESFESKKFINKLCNYKIYYGLKQASRSWKIYFDEIIKHFDFIKNMDKSYVYKRLVEVESFS